MNYFTRMIKGCFGREAPEGTGDVGRLPGILPLAGNERTFAGDANGARVRATRTNMFEKLHIGSDIDHSGCGIAGTKPALISEQC
ncbi:hypothetical protein [Bradyrhizobium lupini]